MKICVKCATNALLSLVKGNIRKIHLQSFMAMSEVKFWGVSE
jgi:hypothetical protein